MFIVKNRILDKVHASGCNASNDFLDELNTLIEKSIIIAIQNSKKYNRLTLKAMDLPVLIKPKTEIINDSWKYIRHVKNVYKDRDQETRKIIDEDTEPIKELLHDLECCNYEEFELDDLIDTLYSRIDKLELDVENIENM